MGSERSELALYVHQRRGKKTTTTRHNKFASSPRFLGQTVQHMPHNGASGLQLPTFTRMPSQLVSVEGLFRPQTGS